MSRPDVSYRTLSNEAEQREVPNVYEPHINTVKEARIINMFPPTYGEDEEDDTPPGGSGHMIHVAPEPSVAARWTHIEDLDSFFSRMYYYHQKHGFTVMVTEEFFALLHFPFLLVFSFVLTHCVKYDVLFRKDDTYFSHKVTLPDVFLSPGECVDSVGALAWSFAIIFGVFWFISVIRKVYHLLYYWDIKKFFNLALKIEDNELDNMTWHDIQHRLKEVQGEQQMCIHKPHLTELDIYNRILRFKNYMVAMINKDVFPVKISVPLLGESLYFSRGYKYNIEMLLFWGPWSPFENNWHLKADYKRPGKKADLANELRRHILYLGLINLVLSPFICLWQMMFLFFSYAELIKREPGTLGTRFWSQYARLHLRHFNELDHELNARLNRAYRHSARYMASFSSPLMAVIAKSISFFVGGIFAVLIILSVYDEDVLTVEHVLTIMTFLGTTIAICRAFIPDENIVWCPQQLMNGIRAHLNYIPSTWRGLAHTSDVRDQFGQLFQYKSVYLLHELISPLVTPLILLTSFRRRAPQIVEFFHNFTVAVVGVGDVCSFAQMDIRKHGNRDWQLPASDISDNHDEDDDESLPVPVVKKEMQGENGKTELSLLHFALTNPDWEMPRGAQRFVQELKKGALDEMREGALIHSIGPMGQSINTLSGLGAEYASLANSILLSNNMVGNSGNLIFSPGHDNLGQNIMGTNNYGLTNISEGDAGQATSYRGFISSTLSESMVLRGRSRVEGPGTQNGLLLGLQNSLGASIFGQGGIGYMEPAPVPDYIAADMALSTLYLHGIHQNQQIRRRRNPGVGESQRSLWQRTHMEGSNLPTSTLSHGASTGSGIPSGRSSGVAERTPLLLGQKRT